MGDVDDPSPGAEAGRSTGSPRTDPLRQRLRTGGARLDYQGSHRAGPHRGSALRDSGEGGGVDPRVHRRRGRTARTRRWLGREIMERLNLSLRATPASRKWSICVLLLLASTINYLDRQTLSNAAVRISA